LGVNGRRTDITENPLLQDQCCESAHSGLSTAVSIVTEF
jgi:hypothetical protein